jgi:hypothetical protein
VRDSSLVDGIESGIIRDSNVGRMSGFTELRESERGFNRYWIFMFEDEFDMEDGL